MKIFANRWGLTNFEMPVKRWGPSPPRQKKGKIIIIMISKRGKKEKKKDKVANFALFLSILISNSHAIFLRSTAHVKPQFWCLCLFIFIFRLDLEMMFVTVESDFWKNLNPLRYLVYLKLLINRSKLFFKF